jgi:hypothetical protein
LVLTPVSFQTCPGLCNPPWTCMSIRRFRLWASQKGRNLYSYTSSVKQSNDCVRFPVIPCVHICIHVHVYIYITIYNHIYIYYVYTYICFFERIWGQNLDLGMALTANNPYHWKPLEHGRILGSKCHIHRHNAHDHVGEQNPTRMPKVKIKHRDGKLPMYK